MTCTAAGHSTVDLQVNLPSAERGRAETGQQWTWHQAHHRLQSPPLTSGFGTLQCGHTVSVDPMVWSLHCRPYSDSVDIQCGPYRMVPTVWSLQCRPYRDSVDPTVWTLRCGPYSVDPTVWTYSVDPMVWTLQCGPYSVDPTVWTEGRLSLSCYFGGIPCSVPFHML